MDENQSPSIAFFCNNTSFNLTFLSITSFDLNINHTAFYCEESNSTSLSKLGNNPITVILHVEVLVIIAAALLAILVLFGSHRRRSGSSFLSLILFLAHTIPNLLVPYTIGLMESANFRNNLFVVWTMFLILSLGRACSISAYTLDDNEHWKRRKILQLVQLFWACRLLLTYAKNWKVALPLAIILVLSGLRMEDTCEAFRLATLSNGVASNTKLVADFMHQENGVGGGEYDPVTMRGYNYLVAGEEKEKVDEASPPEYLMKLTITARVITVDKIWSLTSVEDPGVRMKDTCLSFALYKLLRRRFAGYRLVEAGHPKTLAFVMRGLLSGDKEGERTFRVIEVELAFLYDSFYTTYPVIFSRWFKMLAKSCLLLLVSLWVITLLMIYDLDEIEDEDHTIFDVNVTYALVSSMIGLELCQIIVFVLSDWAKVLAICKFVEKPSLHGNLFYEMIFRFLCRPRRILSRWNGKLGQYSLVDSYNYCPCKLLLCMQGLFLMDKTRKGQKAGPQIKLPKEVKKAIVSSLEATGGKLSNGLSSLSRNEVSDSLSWACKFETLTHTHTILVWHIATSMCQNARERRQTPTEASDDKSNVTVASSLSRYCAYLVAFAPELLPDHKFVTLCIFDNVIKEARRDLAGCRKREKKYDKLTQEGVPEETVMGRGEKLGKQLLQLQEELRWRVLADFWSEMMLYLAPSDNAKAHAEHLAKGGEFITHLWALLSHAGVLQRDDASPA